MAVDLELYHTLHEISLGVDKPVAVVVRGMIQDAVARMLGQQVDGGQPAEAAS